MVESIGLFYFCCTRYAKPTMNDALFPTWTAIFGFIIGAFVGSFLNMAIYRLPRKLSFVEPSRSFCPRCKHSLSAIDLMPLLSWLSTGGKCRYCKEPVAIRYFLVELLTGLIFAGIWWRFVADLRNPDILSAALFAVAASALVMIIFIDAELYIIPDELNAFLLAVGVVYAVATSKLEAGLYGALLGWGLFWGIALLGRLALGKDSMGHGDIKMMRAVGFLIGPLLMLANLMIAVVLGLVLGLTTIAIASRQASSEEEADNAAEDLVPPESVGSLLLFGIWYLLCLDIVGVFFPKIYNLIGVEPESENIEDDDWKPSLTTIPFGPSLAAGAIACMLFGGQISQAMNNYWDNATGAKLDTPATQTTVPGPVVPEK